ncbi:hypothetical protein WMW72_10755 [Paenibacillus filicis]|uniref:Uncharacterized protein n=1 Tax=Paenibacillus filicis TaxID=669464 RepID=A0ABU9DKT2_9BACL
MTIKVEVPKVKLSTLADDVQLAYVDGNEQITAGQLRADPESYDHSTWYVCTNRRWQPNAKTMIDNYIEGEYDTMYEDWDDRARDCLKQEHYDRIQAILDEAFSGDHATVYWILDGPEVEIDTGESGGSDTW